VLSVFLTDKDVAYIKRYESPLSIAIAPPLSDCRGPLVPSNIVTAARGSSRARAPCTGWHCVTFAWCC